jgi:hypothetical protein
MKPQQQRWQIFIDRRVQGVLVLHTLAYWAVCLLMQQLVVFLFVLATSSSDSVHINGTRVLWHIQVSIMASLAIMPLIVLDIVKLSHRWVGPIFRLRTSLHALSLGEPVPPVRFREGDFWQDLALDLNVVTAELNRHRASQRKDNLPTEPLPPASVLETRCESGQETKFTSADAVGYFQGPLDGPAHSPSVPITAG